MSISAVQSRSVLAKTLAFTSNVVSGNLLIVAYGENVVTPAATISDSVGTSYTQVKGNLVSGNMGYLWFGLAPSSGANTVTITSASGTFPVLLIAEFSGATATLDSFQLYANSTGYRTATSTDGDLTFTAILGNHSSDTFNSPVTTTKLQGISGGDCGAIGYQVAASAAVQDIDLNMVQGRADNVVIIVSFLAASAPPPSRMAPRQTATGLQTAIFQLPVVAGNLLVIGFGTNTAGTPSVSDTRGTSYTHLGVATSGSNHGHFYYGVAPSSGANTVTISSSWTFAVTVVGEYSFAEALDVSATSAAASGYTATTTADHDGLITVICADHADTFAAASGCVNLCRVASPDTFPSTGGMGYQNGGALGGQTSGFSGSFADNGAFFVAFKTGPSWIGGGGSAVIAAIVNSYKQRRV